MADASFALCLTHDVDRPHKGVHQALYFAARERSPDSLRSVLADDDPYWRFEDAMALEDDLGVRSAFYFLTEPHLLAHDPGEWLDPTNWIEHLGRYDVTDPEISNAVRRLDAGGWEVGLHGSRLGATDRDRLAEEKRRLESVLGAEVRGGRHHHLRLDRPTTWRDHAALGLDYDASLGSATEYGFQYGYEPRRPFDDEFVLFPLTLMEQTLPDPERSFEAAWAVCAGLLEEAAENGATMTVLWHPRYFNEDEFPGYRRLYRRLVERAQELGAWIGPPAERYDQLADGAGERIPAGGR
jgi:hypothetical protein